MKYESQRRDRDNLFPYCLNMEFFVRDAYWFVVELFVMHYFANKGLSSQSYGFSNSHVSSSESDHKEG